MIVKSILLFLMTSAHRKSLTRSIFGTITFLQKIQYAKNKSDSAAKADGTFDIRLKRKRDEENAANSASSFGGNKVAKIVSNSVPNRILFAQELPLNLDETVLKSLFKQCQGFKEVRMVPGKIKLAFIEFNDETQATIALRQLHGFEVSPGNILQLTYGNA